MYALNKGQTDIWSSWLSSPHCSQQGHASETSSPRKVEEKGKKDGRVWGAQANQSTPASIRQVTTLKQGSHAGLHKPPAQCSSQEGAKDDPVHMLFLLPKTKEPRKGDREAPSQCSEGTT